MPINGILTGDSYNFIKFQSLGAQKLLYDDESLFTNIPHEELLIFVFQNFLIMQSY